MSSSFIFSKPIWFDTSHIFRKSTTSMRFYKYLIFWSCCILIYINNKVTQKKQKRNCISGDGTLFTHGDGNGYWIVCYPVCIINLSGGQRQSQSRLSHCSFSTCFECVSQECPYPFTHTPPNPNKTWCSDLSGNLLHAYMLYKPLSFWFVPIDLFVPELILLYLVQLGC